MSYCDGNDLVERRVCVCGTGVCFCFESLGEDGEDEDVQTPPGSVSSGSGEDGDAQGVDGEDEDVQTPPDSAQGPDDVSSGSGEDGDAQGVDGEDDFVQTPPPSPGSAQGPDGVSSGSGEDTSLGPGLAKRAKYGPGPIATAMGAFSFPFPFNFPFNFPSSPPPRAPDLQPRGVPATPETPRRMFCTNFPQCSLFDQTCTNCKQQQKVQVSEYSIRGAGHDFPPITYALVAFTFLTKGPGCSKGNRAPCLRLQEAPLVPGAPQEGYSYQATVLKLKSFNAAKKEAADWMKAFVGNSDFMDLQPGIKIAWPLRKRKSSEMAGVDQGDHTTADRQEVTEEFLQGFLGASAIKNFQGRIDTWEGGEGWTPGNVPRCFLYRHKDGNVYWEWGDPRQKSGQPPSTRGSDRPGGGMLRDLAASEKAQQSASLAKPDGDMKLVGLAAMAATVVTSAVRRGCPPGAVALCAAAATLLGVSAATLWVARRWRGGECRFSQGDSKN